MVENGSSYFVRSYLLTDFLLVVMRMFSWPSFRFVFLNVLVAAICCFGRMAAFNGDNEDTFFFSSGEGNNRVERKIKRN